MLDHALAYVSRGWQVLPVWPIRNGQCACGRDCGRTAGKHPLSVLVPQGVLNASADRATVEDWWRRYPDANIGIATGERSRIFVVDVDAAHNGFASLELLQQEIGGLPDTLRATTANGGQHIYLNWPGQNVRNTVSQLGPGLDIRGDNGYVVAPPSVLISGNYRWVDPNDPVLDPPPSLKSKVIGASQMNVDPLEGTELLNGVSEGQRDIILFRWACALRAKGIPQELTEEIICFAARKCDPPFEEEAAREKVRRVYRSYRREYNLTDVGNTQRLVDRHGQDIRYCRSGYWITWDGTRWSSNNGHLVVPYAEETVQAMFAEAAEMVGTAEEVQERRDQLVTHAIRTERVERVRAMVEMATYEPQISVFIDDLDKDTMLLNCVNGTVDLRTGSIHRHRREDLLTKIAGAAYQHDAQCPTWERFLEQVLPDPDVRDFVHRAVGYSITGRTDAQVMFFLYGVGANGKSTFLHAIQTILGDYSKQATPDLMMADKADSHPTALADLVGSRFVPTIEVEEGKRLAEAQVKWMTGQDKLKARFMRQDYFEFEPQFKLWLASNHRPMVYGRDNAIWRRILLVPFTVVIPPEHRDPLLPDKLMSEAPGILAWAVRGCLEWQSRGLEPPQSVMAAVDKYKSDMDVLGAFIDECVEPAGDGKLLANDLYTAYSGWCKSNGERTLTQRRFSNQLADMGYNRDRGAANKYVWLDMRLTDAGKDYLALGAGSTPMVTMPALNLQPFGGN